MKSNMEADVKWSRAHNGPDPKLTELNGKTGIDFSGL